MPGPTKRRKYHSGDTHLARRWRVRNRKKDLDQIDEDLKDEKAEKLLNQDVDLDLPGAAQHYCLHCARYFINDQSLQEHFKTKVHKRRLKALELEPYTIEESERAAGLGSFKPASKRKIETQNTKKNITDEDGDAVLDEVSPKQLKQKDIIQKHLNQRKCNINLNKVENLWATYNELKHRKSELDKKKDELSKEIGKLMKTAPESDDVKKYKMQIGLIKDNIRKLKMPLWSAEENAIVEVLKLPNCLHRNTPLEENKVLHTHLEPPNNNKDHLKIGDELKLIKFKKNENYYLTGDAAIFELGAKFYFNDLLRKHGFIQFSNPDFVKSVIVEGCGTDHTSPDATFILHHNEDSKVNPDNRLHLTGGGSLASYFAYLAKNVLPPKAFPLKYLSMGRQYIPSPSDEDSLFHVSQSTVVQFFGATKSAADLDAYLDEMIEFLKAAYCKLGYHYQLSLLPANKLQSWESLRVVVEMYSSSLTSYVEVANISLSGDYISKRLLLTFVENKESKFPLIISGTILNVPKLLGCVLEQDSYFKLPEMFKPDKWSMKM
ncbi:zinc-finger double-stranded RNA-binding domain-containing protein [Phthorimaea operculella]|nr:zinc-finger double-stranded RNA-binding domain-containing protein [Phthorimaea operculella]